MFFLYPWSGGTSVEYAPDTAETMPVEVVEVEQPLAAPPATEPMEVEETPPPPIPQDTQEFAEEKEEQEVEGETRNIIVICFKIDLNVSNPGLAIKMMLCK